MNMNDTSWLDEIDKRVEQKRRDYKGPHCCLTMDRGLVSDANVLNYSAKYCEYGVKVQKTKRYLLMDYCVFCGKKLPPSLKIIWANTLQQEYGLSDPIDRDKKRIPQEFLTDDWWKLRGINKDFFNYSDVTIKKYDSKDPHYCLALRNELLNDGSLLDYSPKYREYGIRIPKTTGYMLMDYCMFCGEKFPESVRDEWFDILEKEYGLERPASGDSKKVPKEFWTDEWWKKRGL
jgi:hypothetical protein